MKGLEFVGANDVVGCEVRVGSRVPVGEGLELVGFIVIGDSVGTLVVGARLG